MTRVAAPKNQRTEEATIRPDFSPEHLRELKALRLCDEQVSELRKALLTVRHVLATPAANGATSELLADVESLASGLLNKLDALCLGFDPEHNRACGLIETSYWEQRPDDTGHSAMLHLIPRLRALQVAAQYGLRQIPSAQPVRRRSADPAPVGRIHSALVYGWSLARAGGTSYRRGTRREESEPAAAIPQSVAPQPQSYPQRLQPSTSPGCDFRTVVGICYDAVGGNADPERAIRAYVREFNKRHAASVKATMHALAGPPKQS